MNQDLPTHKASPTDEELQQWLMTAYNYLSVAFYALDKAMKLYNPTIVITEEEETDEAKIISLPTLESNDTNKVIEE